MMSLLISNWFNRGDPHTDRLRSEADSRRLLAERGAPPRPTEATEERRGDRGRTTEVASDSSLQDARENGETFAKICWALQGKSYLCNPFLEIARPQS